MTPTRPTAESLPIPSLAPIPTPTPSTPPHDPLDKSTFLPPNFTPSHSSPAEELPRVVIEFCDRCRWLSRATWTLTELFLTFPPISLDVPLDPIDGEVEEGRTERKESGLKAISLLPRSAPETGGRFRVWLYRQKGEGVVEEFEGWGGAELVWDRKLEGGFPEMKELKQRIRNLISPLKDLGHSDKDAFGNKPEKKVVVDAAPVSISTETQESAKETTEESTSLREEMDGSRVGKVTKGDEERETVVDDYAPKFRC